MKLAAATALAALVGDDLARTTSSRRRSTRGSPRAVREAVAAAARADGVARR